MLFTRVLARTMLTLETLREITVTNVGVHVPVIEGQVGKACIYLQVILHPKWYDYKTNWNANGEKLTHILQFLWMGMITRVWDLFCSQYHCLWFCCFIIISPGQVWDRVKDSSWSWYEAVWCKYGIRHSNDFVSNDFFFFFFNFKRCMNLSGAGADFDPWTVNQIWSPVPCEKSICDIHKTQYVKELRRQAVFTGCGCIYHANPRLFPYILKKELLFQSFWCSQHSLVIFLIFLIHFLWAD